MGKVVKAVVGFAAVVGIMLLAAPTGGLSLGLAAFLGVSSAVASALITVAATALVTLAFKAIGLTAGTPRAAVGPPQMFRQSIANSFLLYGERRVGGLMCFFHPRKAGGKHYRYFVIAVAGHRCDGLTAFMLNDETVTVDGSNKVTSGPYANAAWLWFERGEDPATANATFVAECGGKWTSDHRGDGIAKIFAKFEMTDAVVEAGLPNITAVIRGKDDIWDPRTETTGYSRNAILVTYDFMALAKEEGGFGAWADEIPDDDWIAAQANVCDETVEGEPRYAIDAVITTGAAPGELRDSLIVNMAGSYAYAGGKHLIRPGYWVPPSATHGEGDLAGPIEISAFLPTEQVATEVQGTYIDPAANYQGAAFATQAIDPPASETRQLAIEFAYITNRHQAERCARIMLGRANCEKRVTWPANITGLKSKALDTVQLAASRHGLDNYAWVVSNWQLSFDGESIGLVLSLREENEEIYDDPAPVTPASVPALATAQTVTKQSELINLIDTSKQVGLTVTATEYEIDLSNHDRRYNDLGDVPVTGDTIATIGDEMVANGGFDDGTGWTLQPETNISGGTLNYVATTDLRATQQLALVPEAGKSYWVTYTVSGFSGTGVMFHLGGANGTARTANGTYTERVTASNTTELQIYGLSGTTASIDDYSVKEAMDPETPYWLYYDDPERAGGAVEYHATTDYFEAFVSTDQPFRHYAGYVITDAIGGTGTTGGGALPPGGGGSNPYEQEP